jgi:hypothetical protein
MTASLPDDVRAIFDRFITCEYTTVDPNGQPITWPVTPYYADGAASIDITTGIGYPKKADDAARHPSVAMLFSDPTGSGIEDPGTVLVQGTAEVDDRDLEANRERYWRETNAKLPATRDMHPPKVMRRMLGWYYNRIYVHVRPERVFVWSRGDLTREPTVHDAHMEEVRSSEPGAALFGDGGERSGRDANAGGRVWDERIDELGERYSSAVLSWLAPDGFPLAARVPVRPDPRSGRITFLGEAAGLPLFAGRACLTAHRHEPNFTWQENFQVRGDLIRDDEGWTLVPRKMVGGFELPEGRIAVLRANLRKSLRFARTARKRLKQREGA